VVRRFSLRFGENRLIKHLSHHNLGGVIKGHYNDLLDVAHGYVREINAGLAVVTPCYYLNEILHTKRAKEQREELIRRIQNQEKNDPSLG
jgi:hypothetical protein